MPDAVRLEAPDWIAARIPAEDLRALLEPATLDLRVNLLKATREEALRRWPPKEGRQSRAAFAVGFAHRGPAAGDQVPRFNGLVEIQDEGSQLSRRWPMRHPACAWSIWCAGAGGKTLALAMTMRNRGQSSRATSRLSAGNAVRRLRRAGVHNVERHLVARRRQMGEAARRELRSGAG